MNNLKQFRRSHFIGFDSILSVLTIILFFFFLQHFNYEDRVIKVIFEHSDINGFLLMIIQIYTTLIGFVLAMFAILLAIESSEKLEYFKSSPHYNKVFDIFYSTLRYLTLGFIFHLFIFFTRCYEKLFFYVMAWLFIICFIKLYRSGWIVSELMYLSKKN